jgi:hypothetical protein
METRAELSQTIKEEPQIMARVRDVFIPEVRGEFYRYIWNQLKGIPPYSIELLTSFYNALPKDSDGELIFPYGELPDSGLELNKSVKIISDRLACYQRERKRIEAAYSRTLKVLKVDSGRLLSTDYSLDGSMSIVRAAIGLPQTEYEDLRSVEQRANDFYFMGGFEDIVAETPIKVFSCCLKAEEPIEKTPDAQKRHLSSYVSSYQDTIELTLKKINRKIDPSEMFDFIVGCFKTAGWLGTLRPIGQLQIFRDMVKRTWSEGPGECKLSPLELLYLKYYVGRTRRVLHFEGRGSKDILATTLRDDKWRLVKDVLYEPEGDGFPCGVRSAIANLFVDYWSELNYYILTEDYKGSFQCEVCLKIIPRSFDASGQKYCSDQCKRRAAKRRAQKRKGLNGRRL